MKLKEFDILLDIKRNKKVEEFEIVQGDYETNILKISLVEDFNEYELSGLSVEIAFAKSDGTTVLQGLSNGISLIGNKIVCTLKTNTIASPGKVLAEVRVLQGLKLLTSSRFSFFVRQSIVNDKTVESTNEFPVLLELINKTNDLITQVNQIEKQVPEQVMIDLAAVSDLVEQLQIDLTTHKTDNTSAHDINLKANKEQGNWIIAILQNGWVQVSPSVKYYKDEFGVVHISGECKDGTISNGTTIATLPDGYRPLYTAKNFAIRTQDGTPVYVAVTSTGEIKVYGLTTVSSLAIDISYRTY